MENMARPAAGAGVSRNAFRVTARVEKVKRSGGRVR